MSTYSTTKQQLIAAPIPAQSRTYKPITHQQLIDLTLESILQAGFKLGKEVYTSTDGGLVANARYTISSIADREMEIMVGWQNSYNKTKSLKFAIGAHIFICDNGCVHGDLAAFKKKHQGNVQEFAPNTITESIKRAGDVFKQMQTERESMKSILLDDVTKAELIGRMFINEEFIQSTQLNLIKRELKAPTYDYGSKDSLWELYQYTTQSMKDIHPSLWMDNHLAAHKFFVNESGILVPKMVIDEPSGPHPQIGLFDNVEVES
jgi:hypothetical protein